MSFKHDMRATTTEYLRRLAEHDAKVEKFKEENKSRLTISGLSEEMDKFNAERTAIVNEGRQAITGVAEQYKGSLGALFTPNGADITDDAKVLSSGLKLSKADLERLWDKNESNTMRRMIWDYASSNGVSIDRAYYTEEMKMDAADTLAKYCHGALSDNWKAAFVQSEQHYGSVVPAAVSEE